MRIKTDKLSGKVLDWAVAKCEGSKWGRFQPSTDWAHGGPIIDKAGINLSRSSQDATWTAYINNGNSSYHYDRSPLIAAMRCYVTLKIGDYVEIPDELF